MLRQSLRGNVPRGGRQGMGAMGWDLFGMNIDLNPMDSPVTQTVVQTAQNVTSTALHVVTQPVLALANATGVDLNAAHSPFFGIASTALNVVGSALGVGPVGAYVGALGAVGGQLQNPAKPYTPSYNFVAPAPAGAPAAAPGAAPAAAAGSTWTAAQVAGFVRAGYRTGTWPAYWRYPGARK
jgi:hypothetical protein